MKILIRFGDNDFWSTFHGVLAIFLEAWQHNEKNDFTKKQICEIINETSLGVYMVRQNQFEYSNGSTMPEHFEHIRKYLKIDETNIYINEEVDKYLQDIAHDGNCENFVLDTDLAYENNNCIYSV